MSIETRLTTRTLTSIGARRREPVGLFWVGSGQFLGHLLPVRSSGGTGRATVKFQYVALWFYWVVLIVAMTALLAIGRAIEFGLESIMPFLSPREVNSAVGLLMLCMAFIAIVGFSRVQRRFGYLFPSRNLSLTKVGMHFDLPLHISGFVSWRDIASVRSLKFRGGMLITIEFKRKLPIGPAGDERELSRLFLRGNRILPSGESFVEAAQRCHAQGNCIHNFASFQGDLNYCNGSIAGTAANLSPLLPPRL